MNNSIDNSKTSNFWKLALLGGVLIFLLLAETYFQESQWFSKLDEDVANIYHGVCRIIAFVLLLVVTYQIFFRKKINLFSYPTVQEDSPDLSSFDLNPHSNEKFKHHAFWLTNLRWIVIFVFACLVIYSCLINKYLPKIVCYPLLFNVAILFVLNLMYRLWIPVSNKPKVILNIQLCLDLIILTVILHFSGGIENPLFMAYTFHVILAGILLGVRASYFAATASIVLLVLLVTCEITGVLEHYTIAFFSHPRGPDGLEHASEVPEYVAGWTIVYAGVLYCTAFFTAIIMKQLNSQENIVRLSAEQAILDRNRLNTIVDASSAGMLLYSKNLEIVWANKRAQEWFNNNRKEHDYSGVELAFESGKIQRNELPISLDQGSVKHFISISSPIFDKQNQVHQVVELIQDVTFQKASEAKIAHSEKIATLGHMAAGIAHEIGNPLSSITTRLDLLGSRVDHPFMQESVSLLKTQMDRIARIVQTVAQISKPNKEEWSILKINYLVHEALGIIKFDRQLKDVDIQTDLQDNLPKIQGVKDQIIQVLLNIIVNAGQAMQGQGKLLVRTYLEGMFIKIEISDSGPGVPEELIHKIFDVFFTTKESGTGIGLALSDHMIRAHGGLLEVYNKEKEQGATFTVSLPLAPSVRSKS